MLQRDDKLQKAEIILEKWRQQLLLLQKWFGKKVSKCSNKFINLYYGHIFLLFTTYIFFMGYVLLEIRHKIKPSSSLVSFSTNLSLSFNKLFYFCPPFTFFFHKTNLKLIDTRFVLQHPIAFACFKELNLIFISSYGNKTHY